MTTRSARAPRAELSHWVVSGSVGGGLVEDDGEAGDLVVADSEVARHDELVRQVGLVVGAVVAAAQEELTLELTDYRWPCSGRLASAVFAGGEAGAKVAATSR